MNTVSSNLKLRHFAKNISEAKISLNDASKDHTNFLLEIVDFSKNTKSRDFCKKD